MLQTVSYIMPSILNSPSQLLASSPPYLLPNQSNSNQNKLGFMSSLNEHLLGYNSYLLPCSYFCTSDSFTLGSFTLGSFTHSRLLFNFASFSSILFTILCEYYCSRRYSRVCQTMSYAHISNVLIITLSG